MVDTDNVKVLESLVADVSRQCAASDDRLRQTGQMQLVIWALTAPSCLSLPQKLRRSITKQALYVLEMLFRHEYNADWVSTFLQLYTSLDDTSLHLFESSFPQMSLAMEHPDIPSPLKSLLWKMALLHRQPTAQKQSVLAFLSLDWGAAAVPARRALLKFMLEQDAFMENGLMPVLAQEKIYRGKYGDEIEAMVDGFYVAAVGAGVDVGKVVGSVLGLMAEVPKPGMLVACARAVNQLSAADGWSLSMDDESRLLIRHRMVQAAKVLRNVCFGNNFGAIRCHEAMMKVGAAVFTCGAYEEMLAYFDEVPRALVVEGGELHEVAKAAVANVAMASGGVTVGENGVPRATHPQAMWMIMYLRDEEDDTMLDRLKSLGSLRDVFEREDVLLPCLQLLTTNGPNRLAIDSTFAQKIDRLGLIDVFWTTACGYARTKFPGAEAAARLMAESRECIERGDRGEFVDNLEPFLSDEGNSWINLRERMAMQWECIALVAQVVRNESQVQAMRMQLCESHAVVEKAIDELLDLDKTSSMSNNADWHALFEVILFNTRVLALVGEALKSLDRQRGAPSKAIEYLEVIAPMMDRGPATLNRSLRGWFLYSIWKAINAFAIEDDDASRVAALAVAGLSRSRDGDRFIVPIIRCMRTIMPQLVAAEDTSGLSRMGMSLIGIAKSHTRRRLGMTAAVITTLLHPSLFTDATPIALRDLAHGFVAGLIEAGQRYARLFVTLSCHLAAMLRNAPGEQRLQYVDVLQELLMSGFDEEDQALDLRNEVLDDPTREELDYVLSAVPRDVARAYRLSQCAPRIAILCLLHEWVNDEDGNDCSKCSSVPGSRSKEVCRRLWTRMYQLARTDKDLSKGTYMHGGQLHKRKLRLWQAIATLCLVVPDEEVNATMVNIMEDLCSHNHASVKYYQELIGLSLVLRQPSLLKTHVFPSLADYSSQRRDDLQSLFCIIAVTLDNLQENHDPRCGELVDAAIEHILPWTGAFPHAIRTFSQIILSDILQRSRDRTEKDRNLNRLCEFFLSNADLKKMLRALGMPQGTIPAVRLSKALHPTGIVKSEGYTLISRDFEPRTRKYRNIENTPMSLVERMVEFLQERRAETRTMRHEMLSQVRDRDVLGAKFEADSGANATGNGDADTFWQRKITYDWSGALGLDIIGGGNSVDSGMVDDLESALASAAIDTKKSPEDITCAPARSLIVVASFIDKIPNLAGLCRTCEIFQAKALVLDDKSVVDHPDFASISVSANTWTPIEEVKRDDVCAWLQTMKREGDWTLVGLEQTDESVSLPDFTFPDRTILVLGAEKEGVPMDVLRLLDATVEIPQLGVIRSLNVHVSAALAIYSCATRYS